MSITPRPWEMMLNALEIMQSEIEGDPFYRMGLDGLPLPDDADDGEAGLYWLGVDDREMMSNESRVVT
jgi:hypothetical protein